MGTQNGMHGNIQEIALGNDENTQEIPLWNAWEHKKKHIGTYKTYGNTQEIPRKGIGTQNGT